MSYGFLVFCPNSVPKFVPIPTIIKNYAKIKQ